MEHSECARMHHSNNKKNRGSMPLDPPNLNPHRYTWYVIFAVKKESLHSFFYISLASGAIAPQTPLVKCECIIFVLTGASGLILKKNMAENLDC